jgi:hypothetical protein
MAVLGIGNGVGVELHIGFTSALETVTLIEGNGHALVYGAASQ